MKVTQFQNIYQITCLPKLFPINCFIVEQKDHLIAVDMGVKGFVKEVESIVNDTGKPVTHLLLTHAHADHTGGASLFKKLFPNAEIGISERDNALLQGDMSLREGEPRKKIKGGFSKEEIKADFTLTDDVGGLQVINTPGHTPGSVSYYEPASKTVIAGDAFQTKGGLAVAGTLNPTFPFPKFATWDDETAIRSAKLLLSIKPGALCVGHGDMFEKPLEQMSRAIDDAERKYRS